ncbi:MAG TPA: methyltransferase [Gemmataceae bacterium]|nr:methyltransferase [Gemmataceae bacterium]
MGGWDLSAVRNRLRPPYTVVLGSPREAAELAAVLEDGPTTCYQMDLYQADRLKEELERHALAADMRAAADLWDLPGDRQTVVFPTMRGGERSLKIDMVEQAFHLLRPRGHLVVLSPYEKDDLFAGLVKKVFGRYHAEVGRGQTIVWGQREGDRPRRRHEIAYQARLGDLGLTFVSRPGVFSYGKLDEGARALLEVSEIHPGDRVLDLGCGVGTNGVFAGLRAGPEGAVTFLDSNLRAVALAGLNARNNGLTAFRTVAAADVGGLGPGRFDVVLANPPYYAQGTIARAFIEGARAVLRPGGRLWLVTRQADQAFPCVEETFGRAEVVGRRGYAVISAAAPAG